MEIEDLNRIEKLLDRNRIRDVIVIGSRGSGAKAALSAARHGVGVTLLESEKSLGKAFDAVYSNLAGLVEVIHGCKVIGVEQDKHRWFEGGEFYLLTNAVCKVPVQFTAIAVIHTKTKRSHVIMSKSKGLPGFFASIEEDGEEVGKEAAKYARSEWRAE